MGISRARYLLLVLRMLVITCWIRAINVPRRLLGMPFANHFYRSFFLRHHRHLLRLRPIRNLTLGDFVRAEGAGSKATMVMYLIAYCRRYGYGYRHTPLTGIDHADRPQAEYDAAWEAELNLGHGERGLDDRNGGEAFDFWHLQMSEFALDHSLTELLDPPLADGRAEHSSFYRDSASEAEKPLKDRALLDLLEPLIPEFRDRYWMGKDPPKRDGFAIAVHVRRGDITRDVEYMWTSLDSYARAIGQVLEGVKARGIEPQLSIYSEGRREDFAALDGPGVTFHLDADPVWTMRQLASADLLVMARSYFSQVAALYSKGVVVYEPWLAPPLDGWIRRDGEGNVDCAALDQALARYMAEGGAAGDTV